MPSPYSKKTEPIVDPDPAPEPSPDAVSEEIPAEFSPVDSPPATEPAPEINPPPAVEPTAPPLAFDPLTYITTFVGKLNSELHSEQLAAKDWSNLQRNIGQGHVKAQKALDALLASSAKESP